MPEPRKAHAVLDLEWRINSTSMSAQEARRFIDELPRRAAEAGIRERVKRVRCPIHGGRARLTPAAGPRGELHFGLSTCCSELEELVALALRYRPGHGFSGDYN